MGKHWNENCESGKCQGNTQMSVCYRNWPDDGQKVKVVAELSVQTNSEYEQVYTAIFYKHFKCYQNQNRIHMLINMHANMLTDLHYTCLCIYKSIAATLPPKPTNTWCFPALCGRRTEIIQLTLAPVAAPLWSHVSLNESWCSWF